MKKLLLFFAILLFVAPSVNATTIDTTTSGYDSTSIVYFGGNATTHYGQTFNIGSDSDTLLNSISFAVKQRSSSAVTFDFNIYEWGGASISGPSLFSSSSYSTTARDLWDTFLVDGIDLALSNNTNYVFELAATGSLGDAQVAATPSKADLYSSGEFVYNNNSNPATTWTTSFWGNGDLAFIMETSSPVPEPATMLLFGLGLLGVAGVSRRRN